MHSRIWTGSSRCPRMNRTCGGSVGASSSCETAHSPQARTSNNQLLKRRTPCVEVLLLLKSRRSNWRRSTQLMRIQGCSIDFLCYALVPRNFGATTNAMIFKETRKVDYHHYQKVSLRELVSEAASHLSKTRLLER